MNQKTVQGFLLPPSCLEDEEKHVIFFEKIEKIYGKRIELIQQSGYRLIIKFKEELTEKLTQSQPKSKTS